MIKRSPEWDYIGIHSFAEVPKRNRCEWCDKEVPKGVKVCVDCAKDEVTK